MVPSGGSTVTIMGLSFGQHNFTPSLQLHTVSGSLPGADTCGTASWTSASTVQCRPVEVTAPTSSFVRVILGALVATRAGSHFTFDGMSIYMSMHMPMHMSSRVLLHIRWYYRPVQLDPMERLVTRHTATSTNRSCSYGLSSCGI